PTPPPPVQVSGSPTSPPPTPSQSLLPLVAGGDLSLSGSQALDTSRSTSAFVDAPESLGYLYLSTLAQFTFDATSAADVTSDYAPMYIANLLTLDLIRFSTGLFVEQNKPGGLQVAYPKLVLPATEPATENATPVDQGDEAITIDSMPLSREAPKFA